MATAARWWALAYLILLAPGAVHRCLAQPQASSTISTGQKTISSPSDRTAEFLQRLADARVFSGAVAVQRGGSIVFNKGYGYAVEVSQIDDLLLCSIKVLWTISSHLPGCRMSNAF